MQCALTLVCLLFDRAQIYPNSASQSKNWFQISAAKWTNGAIVREDGLLPDDLTDSQRMCEARTSRPALRFLAALISLVKFTILNFLEVATFMPTIWWFLKMRVALKHPILLVFSNEQTIFGGSLYGETPKLYYTINTHESPLKMVHGFGFLFGQYESWRS